MVQMPALEVTNLPQNAYEFCGTATFHQFRFPGLPLLPQILAACPSVVVVRVYALGVAVAT